LDDLVLTPDTVIARWSNAALVLHASGHDGGVADVEIDQRPSDDGPPHFQVTGRLAPFAGLVPYGVTSVFDLPHRPDEIVVLTRDGSELVRVT
jgi:hypothetical protein